MKKLPKMIVLFGICLTVLFFVVNVFGGDPNSDKGDPNLAKQDKYPKVYDLPRLNWAIDGLNGLAWGMSRSEVEKALGVSLRPAGFSEGGACEQYECDFSTTWGEQRIDFSNDFSSIGYFEFIKGKDKLWTFWFEAYSGWEDKLVNALFSQFGATKHTSYNSGRRVFNLQSKPPIVREDLTEEEQHYYEWMDEETKVYAYDNYGPGPKRSVIVFMVGWKFASQNATEQYMQSLTTFCKERFEEDAQKYLDWLNEWYQSHKEGKPINITCSDCKGSGKIMVPESQETCQACGGKGKILWRTGGYHKCEPPVGACGGTGKITKPAHWEVCPKCEGRGEISED